uniref:Uncharacterized protein n=1 Tax=uncultured marine virus TaxID=186617 RepID=A0A0F7L5G9_9VIRU|nr:hypothetical protein [uncultured marine virus]
MAPCRGRSRDLGRSYWSATRWRSWGRPSTTCSNSSTVAGSVSKSGLRAARSRVNGPASLTSWADLARAASSSSPCSTRGTLPVGVPRWSSVTSPSLRRPTTNCGRACWVEVAGCTWALRPR